MCDVSPQLKGVLWHRPALGGTLMGFALENNCPSVAESFTSLGLVQRARGASLPTPGSRRSPARSCSGGCSSSQRGT